MADESARRTDKRRARGFMTFLVIYGSCLFVMYFAGTPKETEDFTGRTAREFAVAGIVMNNSDELVSYRPFNLEYLNSGKLDTTNITFLLPEESITIDAGDIHRVEVLEDHGEWQLVAFYYSNTRTSTSVYRAYRDHIEPVSYRLTSSVGHVFGAMALLVPAILLSWIVSVVLNWRSKRLSGLESS